MLHSHVKCNQYKTTCIWKLLIKNHNLWVCECTICHMSHIICIPHNHNHTHWLEGDDVSTFLFNGGLSVCLCTYRYFSRIVKYTRTYINRLRNYFFHPKKNDSALFDYFLQSRDVSYPKKFHPNNIWPTRPRLYKWSLISRMVSVRKFVTKNNKNTLQR